MEKEKVRIVSVGECPKCHKIVVRSYPIDMGICRCESVVQVALEPAIVVSKKRYLWLENLANQANVTVDRLVEVLLDTYIDELYQKGLVNLVKK